MPRPAYLVFVYWFVAIKIPHLFTYDGECQSISLRQRKRVSGRLYFAGGFNFISSSAASFIILDYFLSRRLLHEGKRILYYFFEAIPDRLSPRSRYQPLSFLHYIIHIELCLAYYGAEL